MDFTNDLLNFHFELLVTVRNGLSEYNFASEKQFYKLRTNFQAVDNQPSCQMNVQVLLTWPKVHLVEQESPDVIKDYSTVFAQQAVLGSLLPMTHS